MDPIDGNLLFHFLPIISMLLIMIANQVAARWRQEKRAAREDQGLRTILRMELSELRLVYEENLRNIDEQKLYLMSGRPFLTVSKGNLGRLPLLDLAAMAPVVAALAFNERIEGLIGCQAKPVGNAAYRLEPKSASLDDLREKLMLGREKIGVALDALTGATEQVWRLAPSIDARLTTAAITD